MRRCLGDYIGLVRAVDWPRRTGVRCSQEGGRNDDQGPKIEAVLLDDAPVDHSHYAITGSRLDLTLSSQCGPFTKDLILVLGISEPASLWLLGAGLLILTRLILDSVPRADRRPIALGDHRHPVPEWRHRRSLTRTRIQAGGGGVVSSADTCC